MRRPVLQLLDCTVRRQLRQTTLWLLCGLYLAIVLGLVYPLTIFGSPPTGFESLRLLNFVTAIIIPAYGASRSVDDVASGTLMLMKVAGMAAGTWIKFRLLSIVAVYLTIWMIRLPIYSLMLYAGGATFSDVLWGEALTWCVMVGCAQLSLLVARYSEIEQTALGVSIGIVCLVNAALFLPAFVVLLVGRVGGYPVPDFAQVIADFSKDLSLLYYLFHSPRASESQFTAAIAMAIPLALGAIALFWLRRLLFIQMEPGELHVAGLPEQPPPAQTRPSRRVWDDAFAWQAAEFYHSPDDGKFSVLRLAAAAAVILGIQAWFGSGLSGAIGIGMVFAFTAPGIVPTTCVAHELRQNTLSSLAMLPVGGTAVYRGWLRGGHAQRREAWIGSALGLALLLWTDPANAPLWTLVALVAAYALPPILFTETLAGDEVKWRRAIRIALIVVPFQLQAFVGMSEAIAFVTLSALIYRPRAARLIDARFEAASAR